MLEKNGELHRINQPIATELEITEIANREMKKPDGGKALLFETPTIGGKPSSIPLAINTYGSKKTSIVITKPSKADIQSLGAFSRNPTILFPAASA